MESPPRLVVLLLLTFEIFLNSAVAVPLSRKERCARHCTENDRFQYVPGSTYTYDYETSTTTALSSSTGEKSRLQMRAQVDIEVLSKCEFALRLRGVTLKQTDPQNSKYLTPVKGGRDFARTIERRVLHFSYQDGVVQEICPEEDSEPWVTNIQRGVLSALQNSMHNLEGNERLIETDVSGRCPVEYQSLGRSYRGILTIKKIKDLNTCTDRENSDTSLQGTPFSHGSSIHSRPLLAGQQECEQTVGQGIMQSSSCTELLIFRPFSENGRGATTVVSQKLTYAAVSQKSFTGNDYRLLREHLLYKHETDSSASESSLLQKAEKSLADLCETSVNEVSINTPSKFAGFIYALRKLDYDSLVSLYRRADEICTAGSIKPKKFFLDALPMVSSSESVKLLADMVSRKDITTSEANFWFTSLSFISKPTPEMIRYLMPLLDGQYDQAFLGISALVHTFCKQNDCSQIPEVRDLVYKLTNNLGENCFNPDVRKILLTLKAIGNIGRIYGREKILERCAMNPQLKTEVRIAAIQAFRRFSCDIPRTAFLETYTNYRERSEIRIAAYLAVINCPTSDILQTVKETLENEQVNQVGSFVWTHLQALSKSKHPDRQDIRDVLSNLYLLNKYNSDIRKFSSAHEASLYLESIDSGLHLDTHLVFPTNSYLPHSATLNLTVDIFGHSCNLLQLDGRMEGMERVVEKFFGPAGYFPQKDISKLLRGKRAISDNKIDEMEKEFDIRSEFKDKPYGSLDVKIFGNSLWYNQFEQSEEGESSVNLVDLISDFAEEKTREFSRSFMFLDSTYTIPVTSGLPLRLDLNGTASVRLKVGGKFNVRSFRSVDVHAHVEPSGTVEITGLLTVDAGRISRTGLRIAATLHSSTMLDSRVEVQNGQVVKAEINMPRDRIDIVDVRSKLHLVYGREEREPSSPSSEGFHASSCTGRTTSRVLGIELCSEVNLPGGSKDSLLYPANGAASFGLFLKKTDPRLTKYTFDASVSEKNVKGYRVKDAVISLNTPGSQEDRELSAKFHLSEADNVVTFDLKSPFKKFGMKAKFVNTDSQKKLDMSSTVDEKEIFSAKCDLRKTFEDGGSNYYPSVEVHLPNRRVLSMAATINLRHGTKYGGQLTIKDLTERPIILKGNLDLKKKEQRYEGELDISSYAIDSTAKWYAQFGDTIYSKVSAEYRIMEGKQYKASMNTKVRNLSVNALTKYNGVLNMQASGFPEWNTAISWETMKTTGHLENSVSIAVGDGVRSRVHTIELQEIVRYSGSLRNNSVEANFKVSYPEKNVNYAFKMSHQNTLRTLKNSVEFQYEKNKLVSASVDLGMKTEKPLSLYSDLNVQYPGRKARLSAEFSENNARDYSLSTSVQWQQGQTASLVAQYRDRSDQIRIKHEADGELTFSYRPPITLSASVGSQNNQYAGFVELRNGLERYRASADYSATPGVSHRVTGQLVLGSEVYATEAVLQSSAEKVSCSFDLKMPTRRHVTANADLRKGRSFRTASVELMWDADRDRTKRVGADGELHFRRNGYEGKLTTTVYRRTMRGTFSTSSEGQLFRGVFSSLYKGELEWSPRRKFTFSLDTNTVFDRIIHRISSALTLTTPYQGYEVISLNVRHADENFEWSNDVTCLMGADRKYSLFSDGKVSSGRHDLSIVGSAGIRLPNYETAVFNLTHFHDGREFSNKMQVQWSARRAMLSEVYFSPTESGFKGAVKLKTPFQFVEDVAVEISHGYVTDRYKTNCEIQWAREKMISVVVDSRQQVTGRRRICTMNVEASSTFKGFETVSWKTTYDNDGLTLNTVSDVQWNRNKMTFGISGSRQNTYFAKNFDGKIYFTSPFQGYDRLQLITVFKHTPGTFMLNFDTSLPYQNSMSISAEGNVLSLSSIDLKGIINWRLPAFRSRQKVSGNFEHKLGDADVRTILDVSYGKKEVTLLITGSKKDSYRASTMEGSLSLNTPYKGFEETKVDVTHTSQDGQYESRVQVSRGGESLLLVHELRVKDSLNIDCSLQLTSYMRGVSNAKATFSQVYNPGYFSQASNVQLDGKKLLSVNVRYQDKLPVKEIETQVEAFFNVRTAFNMRAELESGRNNYRSKVIVRWNDEVAASFDSSLRHYGYKRVESQLKLEYGFRETQSCQLSASYDVTAPKKIVDVSVQWKGLESKTISLSGSALVSSESPHFDLIIKTPFEEIERVGFSGRADNRPHDKSLFLEYERNSDKTTLTASYERRPDEYTLNAGFISPYERARDIRFSAKYKPEATGMSTETFLQLDNAKRISFTASVTRGDLRVDGKVSLICPLTKHGRYGLDFYADISGKKNVANLVARWGNRHKAELTAECQVRRGREGNFRIDFKSPIRTLESVTATAQYNVGDSAIDGNMKFTVGDDVLYSADLNYLKGRKIRVGVSTPHSPLRDAQVTVLCNEGRNTKEAQAVIGWEGKEIKATITVNRPAPGEVELKITTETPFAQYSSFNFEGALQTKRGFYQGRIKMNTPLEALRTLEALAELKAQPDLYSAVFKLNTEARNLQVSGQTSATLSLPFKASLSVDAPFANFRNLAVEISVDEGNAQYGRRAEISLSFPDSSHTAVLEISRDRIKTELSLVLQSPLIRNDRASLDVKCIFDSWKIFKLDVNTKLFEEKHGFGVFYERQGRGIKFGIDVRSPLLPRRQAEVTGSYSEQKRGRKVEGNLAFLVSGETHKISATYETDRNQATFQAIAESGALSSSPLKLTGQYVNGNNRDMALTVSFLEDAEHTFVTTVKNYDSHKLIELKLESPLLPSERVSVTGTVKNTNLDAVDGVLTVLARGQEYRLAVNMKRRRWELIEGFLTVNTPHEPLRMLRVDAGYANDRFRNFDFNLKFKSSHKNFQSFGLTLKLNRTRGAEDMSLVVSLPNARYQTIQLLGNLHYNEEMTVCDGRLTLSTPPERYSVYASYKLRESQILLDSEVEVNLRKWSTAAEVQRESGNSRGIFVYFSTPEKDVYSASCSVSCNEIQHSIAVSYRVPWQEPFSANATLDYYSMRNFNAILEASTPFADFSQIFLRLQNQQNSKNHMFANAECLVNRFRVYLNLLHRENATDSMCVVRIGSPYRSVREAQVSYSTGERKRSVDVTLNGRQIARAETTTTRNLVHAMLDIPVVPMTVSARRRTPHANEDLIIKSNYKSRTMSLNYAHQKTSSYWSNEAVFVWDELTGRSLGYFAKFSDISSGKMEGKELVGRLSFPLRVFEVKGKVTKSGRVHSGGIDLFWDAARDKSKYVALGVEHQDLSKRNELSHKVQVTLAHPSLQKELTSLNTLTVRPAEIIARSELQYSRQNEQNLIAEFRAKDLSQGQMRYKAEMNLLHPASELDIKISGEVSNSRAESTAMFSINNLNSRRQRSANRFWAKLDKLRKQINVEVQRGGEYHSVNGEMTQDDGGVFLSIVQKNGENEAFKSRFSYDVVHNSLDLNVTGAENRGFYMSASFPEDSISFKLSHFSDYTTITDAFVFVGLEKSRILRSRVNWRPRMWREFRIATGDVVRSTISSAARSMRSTASDLKEEVSGKLYSIRREMSVYLSPLTRAISRDASDIYDDVDDMKDQFWFMYENNEFFLKDLVSYSKTAYKGFRELCDLISVASEIALNAALEYADEIYYSTIYALEDLTEYLKITCSHIALNLKEFTSQAAKRASRLYLALAQTLNGGLKKCSAAIHKAAERIITSLEGVVKSYSPFIIDAYYYIRLKSDSLRETINGAITSATNSPLYVALTDYWNRIVLTIKAFEFSDLATGLESRILFLGDKASSFMQRLSDSQLLDIIRNRLPVDYVVRSTLQKGADLYDFLGINRLLKNALQYAIEHARNAVLSSGKELVYDFEQLRSNVKYDFDPRKGYFSFEYVLPAPRSNLYDVLKSLKSVQLKKLSEIKDALKEKYYEDFCIWDVFYNVRNIVSPRRWMLPFDAHAMVAGNQHYVTFDKFAFDFAGECSYLLARDFLDGNFTVIVNYKKDGQRVIRKSLTVMTEYAKLEVASDYKVTLDDVKVELPIRAGEMIVIRDGVTVRIENERKGFVLSCNMAFGVCTVGISGFYFGRTGGLFGTYDNEPRLDMMTPKRTLANDVESFVNSWEVGKEGCRKTENLAAIPSRDARVHDKCRSLFATTTSAFRPCFKQVSPTPYLEMCISDLSLASSSDYDSAICTSAAAYFTECSIAGVLLKMPKSCVRCERDRGSSMFEGDVAMFRSGYHVTSADVVFVVEEKKCNEGNYKFLGKLAHSIEDNFRQRGFVDIRYRVVGFGGDDVHAQPHIHTMDGQEYGSVRSVDSAFHSLKVGDGPTNTLEALRFAASQNFHPGSKKVFVLIKCSACNVQENKAEYGELLRTMLDSDVTLHLLMEQRYEMRIANKNTKAKKVIGLDKEYAYTLKDAKVPNLIGDGDLQMQIKIPKDICASLALEVNGSTFDAQYISETKRNVYKKFMDVFARRMAKSAVHSPDWTMCCECIASSEGVGKSACQRCVSSEAANTILENVTTGADEERKNKQSKTRRSEKKRRSQ